MEQESQFAQMTKTVWISVYTVGVVVLVLAIMGFAAALWDMGVRSAEIYEEAVALYESGDYAHAYIKFYGIRNTSRYDRQSPTWYMDRCMENAANEIVFCPHCHDPILREEIE